VRDREVLWVLVVQLYCTLFKDGLLQKDSLTLFLWLKKAQRKSFAKRNAASKGYSPLNPANFLKKV